MYTYNDLHLMRELAILFVLGLLVLVAVLAGMLDSRRRTGRHFASPPLPQRRAIAWATTRAAGPDDGGCLQRQPAWMDGKPVSADIKRAA